MGRQEDARAHARDLVVHGGKTYAEAAEAAGVSLSSLQKWASAEEWQKLRASASGYEATVGELRGLALQRAMTALRDPKQDASQAIYAWKLADAASQRHGLTKEDPQLRFTVALEVLEEFVAYFRDTDTNVLKLVEDHLRGLAERLEKKFAAA